MFNKQRYECPSCKDTGFIYQKKADVIRRCFSCNVPQAEFSFVFHPHPEALPEENEMEICEYLAEFCTGLGALLDREELQSKL